LFPLRNDAREKKKRAGCDPARYSWRRIRSFIRRSSCQNYCGCEEDPCGVVLLLPCGVVLLLPWGLVLLPVEPAPVGLLLPMPELSPEAAEPLWCFLWCFLVVVVWVVVL